LVTLFLPFGALDKPCVTHAGAVVGRGDVS
jgi:hypothetical protein